MLVASRRFRIVTAVAALTVAAVPARAQSWYATLSGPNESPPVPSPGTGFSTMSLSGDLFSISITFSGLLGTTTASHIHCCTAVPFAGTAGVATQVPYFVGFPIGVTSGTYSNVFDLSLASSYNPAFVTASGSVTAARDRLIHGLNSGTTYLNIHSNLYPGGEIRGFIVVTPEPASLLLFATGLSALGLVAKKRPGHA